MTNEAMHILFLVDRYPGYGGIENMTTLWANHFAEKEGWDITILSLSQQAEKELLPQLSTKVSFKKLPEVSINSQGNISNNICTDTNMEYLKVLCRKKRFDTIIYQDSYSAGYKLLPQLRFLCPQAKIIEVEHNDPRSPLMIYRFRLHNKPLLRKLFAPLVIAKMIVCIPLRHRRIYRLADHYVMLSEKFFPIFRRITMMSDTSKLTSIPNPLPHTLASTSSDSKQKICLFVGRLNAQKGIDRLLQAWKQIEDRGCDGWKLHIVGDGELRPWVEDYISKHNLINISLEGFQTDTEKYYRQASIFCMTSVIEGWGLTLLEAMNHGCVPLVMNTYPSVTDIINSNNGLLTDDNPSHYAEHLLSLMHSTNGELESLRNGAIATLTHYSVENISRMWKELFFRNVSL